MDQPNVNHLLEGLNPEQRRAVECGDGPVLVLAGAGSGKTRVLIQRIAYLIATGRASADEIMAVTFTNKAAGEMKERLERLGHTHLHHGWIGTFHSLGARILRREAVHLGLESTFNIYDQDDSLNCVKLILDELDIPGERMPPRLAAHYISQAKNAFVDPQQFKTMVENDKMQMAAEVYPRYVQMLRANNAVDFDDLLLLPVVLFRNHPNILEYYQEKFRYILVDEYQDTNRTQYHLLQLLAQKHRNLFVVGDDDQSIYRWRGADLRNILDFGRDYPDCQVFRLEQNYRSTQNILDAAHSVIVKNQGRHEKRLWTQKEAGEKVHIIEAASEREEAEVIVQKINEEFLSNKRTLRDFVILYRTNAQSRAIEDALRRHGIAYIIVGGIRFYERKEIKDVLAYLKVVANPLDSISLRRIINYPLRGIGEATVRKIQNYALQHRITLLEAMKHTDEIENLSPRLRHTIKAFYQFIAKYISLKDKISVTELANSMVEETGILQNFKAEGTPDALTRMENIRELLNAISEYARNVENPSLEGFLEQVSLITDIDTWDDRSNAVSLMTLHSAKGLEFPVVFISGLEEGLFPLSRNMDSQDELEEERRLFYVGATRAREKLYLTYARTRSRFGEFQRNGMPSRFLNELDPAVVELFQTRPAYYSRSRPSSGSAHRHRAPRPEPEPQAMPDYENFSQEQVLFRKGMRIRHSHFGAGRVEAIEGHGENMKIVVAFGDGRIRKIMVKYATIEIL
ncbi:MAG: UvrD-helicase domain-containing protein [candidate division KSB1 bacterium]|nr:UvrD-helicase domain-containing protein [candidate division KSB1 bacterium]